jgi:hypothetical protein
MAMKKTLSAMTESLVVVICTIAFALTAVGILASVLGRGAAGNRDFVEYWASGYLLVHHANPYDAHLILPLEQAQNFPPGVPVLVMGNPPWSLPLMAPLGLLGAKTAELLWIALSLVCLIASVRMVWRLHGSPRSSLNVLGYTFAPALSCLFSGQVTIFVLFGLVLFLRLHRSRPFLAGASLWLCMLKPHLFLPFGIVLLLWVVLTRSYRILVGTVVALGASTIIADGVGTLQPNDANRAYRPPPYSLFERRTPSDPLAAHLSGSIPPHCCWLHLGACLFPTASQRMELAGTRVAPDACLCVPRPLYVAHGSDSASTCTLAWHLRYAVAQSRSRSWTG